MKVRQDALIIKTWGNRICGLATLVCVACTLQAAGPENRWKNPVDGSWHVDSNWSLEHVPTSGEQAFFPDAEDGSTYTVTVTDEAECELLYLDYHTSGSGIQTVVFTGGGTLGCRATSGTNYIRTKRKLVIDGISVTMGAQMLNYGGLIIKNSASCYLSGKRLYLWANGAYVAVGNSTLSSSGIYVNASETSITLDGGMVAGGVFWNDGKYDNANVAISISGGGSMSGTLELGRNSTLTLDDGALTGAVRFGTNSIFTINGGTWTTDKDVSPDGGYVNDTVTLNLNGGTVVSTGNWLLDDRRWVAGAPDFTFMHTRSGSRRANLATFEDSTVSIQSTLSVTNGGFCTTNAATYIGSGAMVLRNFEIVSGDGPIVSVAKIAMGNADANFDGDVFDSWAGSKYCLAGPMEIGAWTDWVARRASPTPIDISGDLMINTTDYFDDTIGRTIILDRVNVVGSSALTVAGRGVLHMAFDKGAMRFDSVEVQTGATFDPSYGATANRGPVQTRQCVLANGSHLVLTAGNTWLMADTITDGGADVTVTIPSGLADGWYPVVQGELGGMLPSSLVSSVTLAGDSAGWSIAVREGTLFVKKTTSASTGSYNHEWTGAAGTDAWSGASNWYCGVAPTWDDWPSSNDFIPCFGACGGGTLYYDTSRDNAKQFLWLLTADSFMLKSRNINGTANENRFMTVTRNDVNANSGLYSLASTPQYIDFPIRVTGRVTWCAAGRGSLVQRGMFYPSNANEKDMTISGDVRYGGSNVSTPIYHITLLDPYKDAPFTRLTIMNGGNMKVSQQIRVVDYQASSASTSIRIDEGGTLTFAGGGAQYFGWNNKPTMNIIDGTLVLECPIVGGVDQMYVGKGTMKVSTVRPQTADSRVTIGGGLTLEAPAWTTVNTTDPTKAFALSVESTATLRATADFTYGAADGLGDGVGADVRAIKVAAGAELLVDGNGHLVTFADNIAGSGRMVLSNGTFSIEGSASGTIVVTSDATLCLGREMAADAFEFQSGATLSVSGAGSISAASGDIDLSGVKLTYDGISDGVWYLLARTGSGTISGDLDGNRYEQKIVVFDGASTLYIKKPVGIRVIFR